MPLDHRIGSHVLVEERVGKMELAYVCQGIVERIASSMILSLFLLILFHQFTEYLG